MVESNGKLLCLLGLLDSGKGVWGTRLKRVTRAEFPRISDMSCRQGLDFVLRVVPSL